MGKKIDNAKDSSKAAKNSSKKAEATKPAKEETTMKAPTREQLIKAAEDMNFKMGLEPAINVKINAQAIARDIMKNAADLDFTDYNGSKKKDEQITDETKAVLTALGFETPKKAEEQKPGKKDDNDKKKAKSTKELKAEKQQKKAAKKTAAPKYTRTQAFIDAIKKKCNGKGANFKAILDTTQELYSKNGHEEAAQGDGAKKSRLQMLLDSLVAFEVLAVDEKGVYTLVK